MACIANQILVYKCYFCYYTCLIQQVVPSTSGSSPRDLNMPVPLVASSRSALSLTTDFILPILRWNPNWLSEQGTIRKYNVTSYS